MLVTIGYWGYSQGKTNLAKYSFAIALPMVAVVVWVIFAAPTLNIGCNFRLESFLNYAYFQLHVFCFIKQGIRQ